MYGFELCVDGFLELIAYCCVWFACDRCIVIVCARGWLCIGLCMVVYGSGLVVYCACMVVSCLFMVVDCLCMVVYE